MRTNKMGTLGGKIGCIIGFLTAAVLVVPVVHVTPGSCFFEGGCGVQEPAGLILALLVLLALGTTSGFLTRAIVNYLLNRRVN
jgi:hypothetical protein